MLKTVVLNIFVQFMIHFFSGFLNRMNIMFKGMTFIYSFTPNLTRSLPSKFVCVLKSKTQRLYKYVWSSYCILTLVSYVSIFMCPKGGCVREFETATVWLLHLGWRVVAEWELGCERYDSAELAWRYRKWWPEPRCQKESGIMLLEDTVGVGRRC